MERTESRTPKLSETIEASPGRELLTELRIGPTRSFGDIRYALLAVNFTPESSGS